MVNIDKVYQKVLAFANKEQRGYITPQEFNLFADQAQMEIFEQYFYDKNQFARLPGNSYDYSDMVTNLEQKIAIFEKYDVSVDVAYSTSAAAREPGSRAQVKESWGDVSIGEQLPNIYRIGMVRVGYGSGWNSIAENVPMNELNKYGASPLGKWTDERPVYSLIGASASHGFGKLRMKVYPYPSWDKDIDNVKVSFIKTPVKPNWGYVVVNDKPLYNSSVSTDFDLHLSEESELVYRILVFAGIAIEKPGLSQLAASIVGAQVQQEKQ